MTRMHTQHTRTKLSGTRLKDHIECAPPTPWFPFSGPKRGYGVVLKTVPGKLRSPNHEKRGRNEGRQLVDQPIYG